MFTEKAFGKARSFLPYTIQKEMREILVTSLMEKNTQILKKMPSL